MRKFNLQNVVWKEDKCYVSWNLNTGVSSFGDTRAEALESLDEALELYSEQKIIYEVLPNQSQKTFRIRLSRSTQSGSRHL